MLTVVGRSDRSLGSRPVRRRSKEKDGGVRGGRPAHGPLPGSPRHGVIGWDRVGFLFVVIPAPLPILATRRAVDPLERCGACGGS